MRIQKQVTVCKCGHRFDAEVIVDAPIELFLKSLKSVRCPQCCGGYRKLSFPTEPTE